MPSKVKMTLLGVNGNSFAIMGLFQRKARQQGWTHVEIQKVLDECMLGSYDNLIQTILKNIDDNGL